MADRRIRTGECHICGSVGELSFEHVPPRAAFNNKRVVRVNFEQAIQLGPDETAKGPIEQRGAGGYTLCPRCNNLTGVWYGRRFVDWCYQGMDILIRTRGNPTLIYMTCIYPLSVLKQVIAMFFSVNSPQFAKANPELVRFVLNKDAKHLHPRYRFFVYYNTAGIYRYAGFAAQGILNDETGRLSMCILSEINYPPFGYVMTINSPPPDNRLIEFSHFSHYEYEEFAVANLRLPVLPTYLALPGDYRTKKQIAEDVSRNIALEKAQEGKDRKIPGSQ